MSEDNEKKRVGLKAAEFVESGMVVGLGTGSTAYFFITEVARKIREEGLQIKALTSSDSTRALAASLNIPCVSLAECDVIDLYVDGADEIDPEKNLIKGAGGAMVQEKILAASSRNFYVIADTSKLVESLCTKFPVPVECLPAAAPLVKKELVKLNARPEIRQEKEHNKPYLTDQGNLVVDAFFARDNDIKLLDTAINQIPGVLGHGLFIELAAKVITVENGEIKIID